jgi:DNA-binding IclR family transcriptional regulator
MTSETNTVNSVETTFDVIEVLKNMQSAGVSEIADEVGIPVSTAYVHLNTLRKRGYVVKSDVNYRLSLRFLEHGGSVRQQLDYFTIVQDEVNQVAYFTGEIVGFGVEELGQRVVLYRSEGGGAVGDEIPIGESTHLHWTSLGKAIMAHLPAERTEEILEQHGQPQATPSTITDRAELMEELADIREDGYALDDAERRRGIRGVAVPVMSAREEIVGSLGVAGPKTRFDETYIRKILDVLLKKRNIIEIRNDFYH